jgi:hypothetical protein
MRAVAKATPKKLTPRTANTLVKVCKLSREAKDVGDYWIMVDEDTVYIHHQVPGEASKARIELPKKVFNRMVDFYNGARG